MLQSRKLRRLSLNFIFFGKNIAENHKGENAIVLKTKREKKIAIREKIREKEDDIIDSPDKKVYMFGLQMEGFLSDS